MTDNAQANTPTPSVPAVPLNQAAPTPAPSPSSAPTAKKTLPAGLKKPSRLKLGSIVIVKGVATILLMVEDHEGIGTMLPDSVIPGWSASDPRVTLSPSADGLKVSITAGSSPVTGVIVTAKATLPDGTVLSASSTCEPLDVVAVDGGYGMQVSG